MTVSFTPFRESSVQQPPVGSFSVTRRLLRDFYLGAAAVMLCLLCLAIALAFGFKDYQRVEERTRAQLDAYADQINTMLGKMVQHTQFMMGQIGQEIRRTEDGDLPAIAEILRAFRENSQKNHIATWSVFSWVDTTHHVRVTSIGGVLNDPIDVGHRSYVPDAIREPWKIHFSYASNSVVTQMPIVPSGLGITNRNNEYMGVIAMGFDLKGLQYDIQNGLDNPSIRFGLAQEGNDKLVLDSGLFNGPYQKTVENLSHPFRITVEIDPEAVKLAHQSVLAAYGLQASLLFAMLGAALLWLQRRVAIPAMESKIQAAEAKAERDHARASSKAKSVFIANMSHELRTPLNSVIGFSELLQNQTFGPLNPKQQEYVEDIRRSGKTLLDLINDILELSRIDAGKLELHIRPLDFNTLLLDSVRDLTPLARKQDIKLNVNIERELPVVEGDGKRLKQVMHNLISNAVKFTPAGGAVQLSAWVQPKEGLIVQIRDNGIGMPLEEMAIALEKFGQVDSEIARKHQGTGLGLPLARELTQLHGGTLTLASEKGKGTVITLTFPAHMLRDDLENSIRKNENLKRAPERSESVDSGLSA